MKPAITGEDVWMQLEAAGIAAYLTEPRLETKSVYAQTDVSLVAMLTAHPSFKRGIFHGCHPDLGPAKYRVDFRAHRKEFGKDHSLQVVMNKQTGKFYADLDLYSFYEDLAGAFGHTFLEVLPNWFRRKRDTQHATLVGAHKESYSMSLFKNPLAKKLIGTGVRTALATLGGVLVANGYAQSGQIENLLLELTPIVLALVLSGLEKISTQATIEVARTTPVVVTKDELNKDVAALPLTEKIEKASVPTDAPVEPPPPQPPERPMPFDAV